MGSERVLMHRVIHVLRGWLTEHHLFVLRLRRASLLDTLDELESQYADHPSPSLVTTILSCRRALVEVTLALSHRSISLYCPLLRAQPTHLQPYRPWRHEARAGRTRLSMPYS